MSEEQLDHLSIIGRNEDELRAMIDDLLQVTKTEINEIFKVSPHKSGTINLVSDTSPITPSMTAGKGWVSVCISAGKS